MKRLTTSVTAHRSSTKLPADKSRADWRLFAAAGAAALAATSATDADIIYTNPSVKPLATKSHNTSVAMTIGGSQLKLRDRVLANNVHIASASFANSNAKFFQTASRFANNYKAGQPIGGGGISYVGLFVNSNGMRHSGNFVVGQTGIAGLDLANGDLGWLRVEVFSNGDGLADELKAIDWAYNNVSGASINAGDTGSTPEPSALALLALGSAGVLTWRRRRSGNAE